MPYVQLQMSADKFLAMFREGLQAQLVGLLDAEFPVDSAALMIDRVDILPTTSVDDSQQASTVILWGDYQNAPQGTPVDRTRYVIVQPLTLHPVLLLDSGTPTPTLQPLPGVPATLRVAVDAWSAADWVPRLFLEPQSFAIDAAPSIPGVPPALVTQVLTQVQQQVIGSLKATSRELTPETPLGKLDYVNTGLAFDQQKSRMAILMQSRPSIEARVWVWRLFHGRHLDDLLQSGLLRHDWAQSMDSWLVEQGAVQAVEQGLKEKADELKATAIPAAKWSNPGGKARMSVFVPIEQNAPDPLSGVVDLDVHSEIAWDAVPVDTMQMTMAMSAVVTGASFSLILLATAGVVLGVALTSGIAWAFFGPLSGMVLGAAIGTGLALLNTIKGPSLSPGSVPGMTCTEGPVQTHDSSTKFTQDITCTKVAGQRFSLEGGRSVRMLLNEVRGLPSAMVTSGAIELPPPQSVGFTIETAPMRWLEPSFPCSASFITLLALHRGGHLGLRARGQISVVPHHQSSPVEVRSATLRSADPRGVLDGITVEAWGVVYVHIRYDAQFQNAPYPFWILLHTTKGVRLVKVDPPPPITEAEKDQRTLGGILDSISDCYAKSAPFYVELQGINIKWIPDPPPDFREVELLWNVRVRGLAAGERVQVSGPDQRAVATIHSTARGEAAFVGSFPPALGRRLSLQRVRSTAAGISQPMQTRMSSGQPPTRTVSLDAIERLLADCNCAQHIEIEQTVLLHRSHVEVPGPLRHLLLDRLGNLPCLVAIGRDESLTVIDVSEPARPTYLCSLPAVGVRGAVVLGDSLLVYGDFGLIEAAWPITPSGRCGCGDRRSHALDRWQASRWMDAPVRKVRRHGSVLYVQGDTAVDAVTSSGHRIGVVVDASCQDIEVVGNHLYALVGGMIQVFRIEGADGFCTIATFEENGATGLSAPSFGVRGGYLFVRSATTGRLLDVANPASPELVSRHDADPVWARAVMLRSTIAISDGYDTIAICTTEASARGEIE
jgi:hypothetical protein